VKLQKKSVQILNNKPQIKVKAASKASRVNAESQKRKMRNKISIIDKNCSPGGRLSILRSRGSK
jgi:hypothetical protein